jgi:hypothetical protein
MEKKMLRKGKSSKSSISVLMRKSIFCLIVSFVFFCNPIQTTLAKSNNIVLADKGQSNFDIVQVGQVSSVEQTAISELGDYLHRISGAQFVIKNRKGKKPAIFVGDKNQQYFEGKFLHLQLRNSFSIRTQQDSSGSINIYLVGQDSTATAFAIYTFLEDLGCRWFMPGKIGEVIPEIAKMEWNVYERTEKPDFPFRQIWWAYGGPEETAGQFKMWKLRNKVAYSLIKHGHNLTATLPPEKYLDRHPEYYALVKGERQPSQLCTSNPEVIRLVIERINRFFDENPQYEAYSLCPDDNTNFCECDNCKALDVGGLDKYYTDKPVVTDRYIHFLNAIVRGIQQRHPGKKVSTYAYVNYSTPPIREKIDPNVIVIFTSSVYCGAHGIGDLHCSSRQEMKRDLAGWTDASSEIYIYDYDPTPYNAELPWPLFGARYREMSEYLAMGIKGFTFENRNSWATMAPNFYVTAKTMWNANLDFNALMDDYAQNFFAESATEMAEYYRILEAVLATTPNKIEWGQTAYPQIFPNDILLQCRNVLDKAISNANSKAVQERVKSVSLGFEYLENYIQLRMVASLKLSLTDYKNKYNRCKSIIDELYEMNKDYILHDVALEYLDRGLGKIATSESNADLGLVNSWMLIGSFDNTENKGHDSVYPPEKEIDFTATYTGLNGDQVKWKEHHNPEYLGKIDFLTIFKHVGNVCAYGAVTVESPKKQDVQIRLGSNDYVKMWLNGKQKWNWWNSSKGRHVTLDNDIFPVTLPKGKSQILLKISNVGGNWGFCFRITDKNGNKITGLNYSL